MKKISLFLVLCFCFILLSSCTIDEPHVHQYVDGMCDCGEIDEPHVHQYIDGMCDCGEYDAQWLNENFDISEEKILFKGSVETDFSCDIILLTLKHTTTYIELSKRHFKIDCITKVEYVGGPRPPEYFFQDEYKHLLEKYNQIVFLHVNVQSKSKIIKLIKELEKLEFIRSANVNLILTGDV